MSQGSLSVTSNDALVGDPSRRITVPRPKNLNELRTHAHKHFRGGRGLFHHGMKHVAHDDHVNDIVHDDVIVVLGDREVHKEAPPVTTHASHYVKHPLESRSVPPARAPPTPTKFEGRTSYDCDFIKHPLEGRQPHRPATSHWTNKQGGSPLGKSSYSQHYPWHDVQKPHQMPRASAQKDTPPFEGQTSYSNDFVKHPLKPRTPAREVPRPLSGPFEGSTTYNQDFHKHPHQVTKPLTTQSTLRPHTGPFNGSSEYAQEYLKHEIEKPHFVHLEPELRRERRPRSASRTR